MLEVRELRKARGWNQTELAYHAGLAPSVISQIENGKRDPSASTLRKLANAFGVEVGDLFPKAQSPLPLESPQGASPEEAARKFERNWMKWVKPIHTERAQLLEMAQDAARQDEEKDARAVARLHASEGVPQSTIGYQEDAFRVELRAHGFPDEHFEGFIWPLVVKAVRADRLERELVQLRGETAELRSRLAEAQAI